VIAKALNLETHFRSVERSFEGFAGSFPHDVLPYIVIGALIVFLVVSALGIDVKLFNSRQKTWHRRSQGNGAKPPLGSIFAKGPRVVDFANGRRPADMSDTRNQLDAIGRVSFEPVRLLNREEYRLLPIFESVVSRLDSGHRVMAQTSLGEVIRPAPKSGYGRELRDAHASINSKRLDFAVFDRRGIIVCAIEYQGTGHHQNNAFMRDAVKREALRRAGVPFMEIPYNFDPAEVEAQFTRILSAAANSGSQHGHSTVHM